MTLRRAGALAWLVLVASCSKPNSEAPPTASATEVGSAKSPALPESASAPLVGPLPTPEDVEAETEHRITEQNLESELDRLEREIQAE